MNQCHEARNRHTTNNNIDRRPSLAKQTSLFRQTSFQPSIASSVGQHAQEQYLRSGFRQLYLATRLAGLIFYRPADGKWTFQAVASIIYYTILLIIVWANVVRYAFAYDPSETFNRDTFTPELMVRVVIHIVYIHTALTYTVCLSISLRRSHILTLWTSYYVKYGLNPCAPVTVLQKRGLVGLTVVFLTWVCSIAIQLLEPLTDSPFGLLQLKPFIFNHLKEVPAWLTFVMTLLNSIVLASYCLYITWIIVIGLSLKDEYKSIAQDFIDTEEADCLDLESIRIRHLDLSGVVQEVDSIMSFYILVVFACNVPCVCISIYHLILWDLPLEYKALIWVCLSVSLLQMITVISISTWLNEQACQVKDELYRLNLHNGDIWPQIKMMQYLTFLNYVTEGNIGFTAWRIFYLRKHTLKMVVLWVISYTVVLLKFGTALNPDYPNREQDLPVTTAIPEDNITTVATQITGHCVIRTLH